MRIGIDIDDTITNSWKYLKPIYEKEFNIKLDENSLPYYGAVQHLITFEEFIKITSKYEKFKIEIPLKEMEL